MFFKRFSFSLAAFGLVMAMHPVMAQEPDSTSVEQLQEVVVSAVWAPKDAPFAVANIGRSELKEFSSTGRELPMLFSRTPGIIAWSENGVGTGTSYLRIRGAGGSRINVTIDGVPLNSPEDQSVFWVNMNSYGKLLGSAQIQRGVGTSTNGDGAFGGTIALATLAPAMTLGGEVDFSYGSWNTMHLGARFTSGLLWNRVVIDAAYNQTSTNGYLPGTNGRSGSYYGGVSYLGGSWKLSYKLIGNFEKTGQAWNGVTAGTDDLSLMDGTYGYPTGIKTYKDMYNAGLGKYNSLYERLIINSADPLDCSFERYELNDGTRWARTTDNFWQNHHLLNFAANIGDAWKLSATAHFTGGHGWYEEFRYNNKLSKFGLPVYVDEAGNTVKRCDFIRKKGLTQRSGGLVANLSWQKGNWDAVAGISLQQFNGNHYGYLPYISCEDLYNELTNYGKHTYKYYNSDASKFDGSLFLKATYKLSPAWSFFGDLQYRGVHYATDGFNDKYIVNEDGSISRQLLDVNVRYNFFNPKAGVNYSQGPHRAYASFALSHREPERNNFTDNGKYPAPRAERLYDFEAGYQLTGSNARAGINLYYMRYRD